MRDVDHIKTSVLIVGAGPAGASAALSILNYSKLSVILVEQSDLNQIRVGEHVSSSIFQLIDYLKINKSDFEPNSFMPAYNNASYWGNDFPVNTHSIFSPEGATFQLDREKFDFTLMEQVAIKGGRIFPRTKCTHFIQHDNDEWEVSIKHSERGEYKISASYLVDATGRQAHVCRQLGVSSKKIDVLMGTGMFLQASKHKATKHEQLLESTELGWWYTAYLPNNKITATFFTDSDIISEHHLNQNKPWHDLLAQTKYVKKKLQGASFISPKPWIKNAFTQLSNSVERKNFIAIGDAASSFDPISSMGIGFALSSACHAAKLIDAELSNTSNNHKIVYQQDISNNFKHYLELRRQFYQMENRWPDSKFWLRRHSKSRV